MHSLFKLLGHSKRLTSFAAFGVAGVMLTATWAAGVASSPAANSTAGAGAAIVAGAPASGTDRFASAVALGPDTALTVNFSGRWGLVPNTAANPTVDYELFDIDLSNASFDTGTYFVEVGILPTPLPAGFTAIQVEWFIDDVACATSDFTPDVDYTGAAGTVDFVTMYADTVDNSVVFPSLTDDIGPNFCVGVKATGAAIANDTDGTFIRRAASGAWAGTMPTFVAIVNEHT